MWRLDEEVSDGFRWIKLGYTSAIVLNGQDKEEVDRQKDE